MQAVIISAGEFFGELPAKYDLLIAADGGYAHCQKLGITPDIAVGDFDSLGYIPNGDVITLPSEKNESDTFFAVDHALKKGYRKFHIFGGTGGRISHTLANIQTLAYIAKNGGQGFLYGERETVTVIFDMAIRFDKSKKGYISIFALDKTCKVTIRGLKYNLEGYELSTTYPLGLSNEFIGENSCISVLGTVAIVIENQDFNF